MSAPILDLPPRRTQPFAEVGRCIYCHAVEPKTPLEREHIVMRGLGGDAILPKASCRACADVTKKFEQYCSQVLFGDLRVHFDIPEKKRRPAAWPTAMPIQTSAGRQDVAIPDHPGIVCLPVFDVPGMIVPRAPSEDLENMFFFFSHVTPDPEARVARLNDLGHEDATVSARIECKPFMQMIAKIAHASAVAEYGIDSFTSLLRGPILTGENLPAYIGGQQDRFTLPPWSADLSYINPQLLMIGGRRYLVMFIQLFRFLRTPVYSAIVGEFKA